MNERPLLSESSRIENYGITEFSDGRIEVVWLGQLDASDDWTVLEFKPSKIVGCSEVKWFTDDMFERKLAKLAIAEHISYEPEIKC